MREVKKLLLVRQQVFYNCVNIVANILKTIVDLLICKANNLQVVSAQDFGTETIFCKTGFAIVLRAVNLDYEFYTMAIKICYKIVDWFLTLKTNRVF